MSSPQELPASSTVAGATAGAAGPELRPIGDGAYEIPASHRHDMRVPVRVIADDVLRLRS